jgi:Domain of unknown function (DUF4937
MCAVIVGLWNGMQKSRRDFYNPVYFHLYFFHKRSRADLLLKLINCQVCTGKEDIFHLGQASWGQLNTIPGFLGQIGGWNTNDKNMAHIISLWKDINSYQYFINNVHDEIYENSSQTPSILNIEVETFAISLPYSEVYKETADYLTDSICIRIELSQVNRLQSVHFTQVGVPWMLATGKVERALFGESYKQENLF